MASRLRIPFGELRERIGTCFCDAPIRSSKRLHRSHLKVGVTDHRIPRGANLQFRRDPGRKSPDFSRSSLQRDQQLARTADLAGRQDAISVQDQFHDDLIPTKSPTRPDARSDTNTTMFAPPRMTETTPRRGSGRTRKVKYAVPRNVASVKM